jgi:ParB-like chromosome segregation protein Spo0J
MDEPAVELRRVEVGSLGERLSSLRLCEAGALEAVRRSLAQHGQLSALTLFVAGERLEIVDGFKRVRAARELGLCTLLGRVDEMDCVEAKLRLCALQERRGLTELEEGWLVRSLYREDGLKLAEIARVMRRHKSWVWRRLMLVEALEPTLQADVRLGLFAPRAAVAVSRLPRGNQQAASAVVMRRGLTVRQTESLVEEALAQQDPSARAVLLLRRLDEVPPFKASGPRPTRGVRSEADGVSADILKLHEVAARLSARLYATPLGTLQPAVSELLRDALLRLSPVLGALGDVIATIAGKEVSP